MVREVKKTIKGARYEENGDEARKVTERLNGAEKSLMDALPEEEKPGRRAELFYMAAMVLLGISTVLTTSDFFLIWNWFGSICMFFLV